MPKPSHKIILCSGKYTRIEPPKVLPVVPASHTPLEYVMFLGEEPHKEHTTTVGALRTDPYLGSRQLEPKPLVGLSYHAIVSDVLVCELQSDPMALH